MVKKPSSRELKIGKVYDEFKAGTLRSSSGQKVVKKSQAVAIALSEARRPRRTRRPKRMK